MTEFKGALALGLAGTGRLDEALVALDDAMAADREGADGHGWYAPELLRIKGEVLLQQAGSVHSPWRPKIALTRRPKWPESRARYSGSCGLP